MQYIGLQSQIDRNNRLSVLQLLAFPCIILGMTWVFLAIMNYLTDGFVDADGNYVNAVNYDTVNYTFAKTVPWVCGIVGIWFVIAYVSNASMVRTATGARPLQRRDNPRVYNIVENLCMTCGMDMPQINIIDDPQLNAFASGIDRKSYTVTVTTGLLALLDDDELAGVIGHELTHIRNRDTRLLITSIIFVGIVSTVMGIVMRMVFNMMLYGNHGSRDEKERNSAAGIMIALVIGTFCCAIAYLFTLLTRFAISRRREYMADAGGAELCGNPLALASALRKISGNPGLQNVGRDDIAQLFIIHPQSIAGGIQGFFSHMFSTHPDTNKRIAILEQF